MKILAYINAIFFVALVIVDCIATHLPLGGMTT
jgi:hypothetical protein